MFGYKLLFLHRDAAVVEPPHSLLFFQNRSKGLNLPQESPVPHPRGVCCSEEVLHSSSACQQKSSISFRAGKQGNAPALEDSRTTSQSRAPLRSTATSTARPRTPRPRRRPHPRPHPPPSPSWRDRGAGRDSPPRSSHGPSSSLWDAEAEGAGEQGPRQGRRGLLSQRW